MNAADDDVPSPIDFHDPEQARAWEKDTIARRPWRLKFFAAFAKALNEKFDFPIDVLELGSGPGHLAGHVLRYCNIKKYTALDFSEAMHALARERLSHFPQITYVTRDFRHEDWAAGLGGFDAVLTMQAAHETRHKKHLPQFLMRASSALRPEGLFLYCDHYAEEDTEKNDALYVARAEQLPALKAAGLHDVRLLLDEGGMALYSGGKA